MKNSHDSFEQTIHRLGKDFDELLNELSGNPQLFGGRVYPKRKCECCQRDIGGNYATMPGNKFHPKDYIHCDDETCRKLVNSRWESDKKRVKEEELQAEKEKFQARLDWEQSLPFHKKWLAILDRKLSGSIDIPK